MRCLPLIFCALLAAQDAPAPVTNLSKDGKIPTLIEGQPFSATLAFKNPYDRAFKITDIESDCSCTRMEASSRFLLPNEEATFYVVAPTNGTSDSQRMRFWLYASDPEYQPIIIECHWNIIPMVTVDRLPPGKESVIERPEKKSGYRDLAIFLETLRPEEQAQLQKNLLISSPESQIPEGGLKITAVEYTGPIWSFTVREHDKGKVLLLARAKDPNTLLPVGIHEEKVIVKTNHPGKPTISLQFKTAVDPKANTEGFVDPFAKMR
jgi:hypothetical protein